MSHLLHLSRRLSYHAPIYRHHRLVHSSKQWKRISSNTICKRKLLMQIPSQIPMRIHVQFYSQKSSNVFTFHNNLDMLRKRISFSEAQDEDPSIVPVGVIVPKDKKAGNMKIVLVPLDLENQDPEVLKKTLTVISELRKHSTEIDMFTNSIIEDYHSEMDTEAKKAATASASDEKDLNQIPKVWENYQQKKVNAVAANATSNVESMAEPNLQPAVAALAIQPEIAPSMPSAPPSTPIAPKIAPMPLTSAHSVADSAPAEVSDSAVEEAEDSRTDRITIEVPQELGQHLNELAVSSMQLSFEMNMTNILDAILHGDEAGVLEDDGSLGGNPMVMLQTQLCVDPNHEPLMTVPVQFNALIKGTVELDAEKLNPEKLTSDTLPQYNDEVTSLAAHICSTALQRGFSTEPADPEPAQTTAPRRISAKARMALKRHQAQKHMKMGQPAPMSTVASPALKDGCKNPIIKKKKKCPKPCKLDDPCKEDPCKRPDAPKNPTQKPKKAESQVDITASSTKGACKQGGQKGKGAGKGKDASSKCKNGKGGKGAKGGDGKNKCGKGKGKGKSGKGKEKKGKTGPCWSKGEGKKKSAHKMDPCRKFKALKEKEKSEASKCKGSGDKSKEKKVDPCAKFKGGKGKDDKGKGKKDPCEKFKKGKDDKGKSKKDPCEKFKGGKGKDDKGKGKKDPCEKFKKGKGDKGKAKKDPCEKFKKGKGGKGNGKGGKKDPCAKFRKGKPSKGSKGKGCKNTNKKKFSTVAAPAQNVLTTPKRHLSILLSSIANMFRRTTAPEVLSKPSVTPRYVIRSTLVRRHMSRFYSKRSKGSKNSSCGMTTSKSSRPRKHQKARTALRTDCFGEDSETCFKPKIRRKCSSIKTPRKKCEKMNKKSLKKVKMPKKPKKKLSPMCAKLSGRKDKERNKMHNPFHSLYCSARNISQDSTCPETASDTYFEVVRIPTSYQICKEPCVRPLVKNYDVLIRTGSVALTGSDIHVYENSNRDIEGMTLGHDATGFVEELGNCVKNLHVGDRVVVESGLSCGVCDFCKKGLYNMCSAMIYTGFLASHQSHPADLCHRLPDTISMEEGTLIPTLAVGCQACFKANITPTSNVLIIGPTPTGVAAALCAESVGARKVVIAGSAVSSLDIVNQDFGFSIVKYNANPVLSEVLEAIHKSFKEWPNCIINCAVSPMTMNLAIMALQPNGVCVLSECDSECASFNGLDMLMKNIRIIPSFRSANMFPTAIQLMKAGCAPMHKLIATIYPWSMLEAAFQCAQHESNIGIRKVVVNSTDKIDIGRVIKQNLKSAIGNAA